MPGLTSKRDVVVVHRSVNGLDRASDVDVLGRIEQILDGGVLGVSTEDVLCLLAPDLDQPGGGGDSGRTTHLSGR